METIMNAANRIIFITLLNGKPVQLLNTFILQQCDEGVHLLLKAQQEALHWTNFKT